MSGTYSDATLSTNPKATLSFHPCETTKKIYCLHWCTPTIDERINNWQGCQQVAGSAGWNWHCGHHRWSWRASSGDGRDTCRHGRRSRDAGVAKRTGEGHRRARLARLPDLGNGRLVPVECCNVSDKASFAKTSHKPKKFLPFSSAQDRSIDEVAWSRLGDGGLVSVECCDVSAGEAVQFWGCGDWWCHFHPIFGVLTQPQKRPDSHFSPETNSGPKRSNQRKGHLFFNYSPGSKEQQTSTVHLKL